MCFSGMNPDLARAKNDLQLYKRTILADRNRVARLLVSVAKMCLGKPHTAHVKDSPLRTEYGFLPWFQRKQRQILEAWHQLYM